MTRTRSLPAARGAIVRDGTDVTVIACGILVHKAIEAAEQMAERGVSVRVVDMYSIKPIDRELILRCAQETGCDRHCRGAQHLRRSRQRRGGGARMGAGAGCADGVWSAFPTRSPRPASTPSFSPNMAWDAAGVVRGIERVLARKH